jgi:hypothetical protein
MAHEGVSFLEVYECMNVGVCVFVFVVGAGEEEDDGVAWRVWIAGYITSKYLSTFAQLLFQGGAMISLGNL